jgi:hypothetical protein
LPEEINNFFRGSIRSPPEHAAIHDRCFSPSVSELAVLCFPGQVFKNAAEFLEILLLVPVGGKMPAISSRFRVIVGIQ